MSCIGYRANRSVLFVIGLILFAAQPLMAAGTGTIKGKVLDRETKEPLPGATVLVKGTSLGAATNISGEFSIHVVPAGNQTLSVTYVGYVPTTVEVTVEENKEVERDILLEATAITGRAVVVTAQAQGQLGAINQQLSSNTIENVVSKARIQEMPDVNAAESIGRLPGVSIERSGGEATKVEIRGLGPKYSLITVNGVILPATGSVNIQPNGQTVMNSDRSVDLSLIPSNMLDGITLKKVVTPDMDPDVLGGTVDLKLKEAPRGFQASGSAQGGYNRLQNYYGNYNIVANVSNRFFKDKFGVIAGGHIDNYDRSADKFQGNYDETQQFGVTQAKVREMLLREDKVDRKRHGASLLLDYAIPSGKINANGFYNQLNAKSLYHFNDMWVPGAGYNSNRHIYTLEQSSSTTSVFTSALGVKQDFNWISYDASLSRSGSFYGNPNARQWQFMQDQGAFPGNLPITPTTPTTVIADSAVIDTNATKMAFVYVNSYRLIENQTSGQLNFQIPFKLGDQMNGYFKAGGKIRWLDRRSDQNQEGQNGINYATGTNQTVNYIDRTFSNIWGVSIDSINSLYGWLPITPFLTNYHRSNFLNGDYALGLIPNEGMLNQIADSLSANGRSLNIWRTYYINTLGYDYDGTERYSAGYVMAEFNLGRYLTVIPGVRVENEYTRYHGQTFAQYTQNNQEVQPSVWFPDTTVRSNTFWLPMINVIVRPTDWLQIKLARTETLARPDFLQYAPITYIDALQQYITAANSGLKTSKSTNYDAAVSVYNNTTGLVSLSGFYKEVKDLVFFASFIANPGTTIPDSAGLNIIPGWLANSPRINTYINNPFPATYYGFEAEWQTNFWYLPGILHGLVLDINYTHIFSQMKLAWYYDSVTVVPLPRPHREHEYIDTTTTTRMPNQPSHIFNVTLGYDLGGFSARLSYLFQTDKLTTIGYAGTTPSTALSTYSGRYGRWDLTLQQKLGKHVQLFANLNNLNAEPDKNYIGGVTYHPSYMEYYGFTMDLGVRYTL